MRLLFLNTVPLRYGARRRKLCVVPRRHCVVSAAREEGKRALVIVESPAKARTIAKYVPSDLYDVTSCVGHVRELPSSAKRIPAKYKGESWARLGVNVSDGFRPLYVLIEGKRKLLGELRARLADKTELILATDDDREGEAISWHLVETLKPDVPVRRAVFREITREAVLRGLLPTNSRDIDMSLVRAQETRRVVDRLAGYTMSPLLWKKIARGLSAGRVQSVAMAQLVQRELARLRFVSAVYPSCSAQLIMQDASLEATLAAVDRVRLARGADFNGETGLLRSDAVRWYTEEELQGIVERAQDALCRVLAVERRASARKPPLPLITSTLQQECGNRLGMGAGRTMRAAQKLYENGFITYMRTDNPAMSLSALQSARECAKNLYGDEFVAEDVVAAKMPKGAQAAHEAIRPAGATFKRPEDTGLEGDELRVYSVIFRRTLAATMKAAQVEATKIVLETETKDGVLTFRASGSIIAFPGFLLATKGVEVESSSQLLPEVVKGDELKLEKATVASHETKAPARYNDASLVKALEELGVGRPSTYAAIIEKLIERGYAFRGKALGQHKGVSAQALVPSLPAFAVERLLSMHFPEFVDAQFTARMESTLDDIAAGAADPTQYLETYYSGANGLAATVARTESGIDPTAFRRISLPNLPSAMCSESKSATPDDEWASTRLLVNSYGPYIERNGSIIASLPKTTLADELSTHRIAEVIRIAQNPPRLGLDPTNGRPIYLKTASYGPYVQLGHDDEYAPGEKPKRASLLPGMNVAEVDVATAVKLLELPRLVGTHPVSGAEIRVNRGPYGPYISHDGVNVALRAADVLSVALEECVVAIDAAALRREKRMAKLAEKAAGEKTSQSKSTATRRQSGGAKKTRATKNADETKKTGDVAKRKRKNCSAHENQVAPAEVAKVVASIKI